MCRVLEVSRSGYYDWRQRPESRRAREDRALLVHIRAYHKRSRGRYGSPRVHKDLVDQGHQAGRGRVARLMRQEEIRGVQKRRYVVTTDSDHRLPVAPNILDRRFEAGVPNEVWTGDITYIPTKEGWLYLAVLHDLFSRLVVGWNADRCLYGDLTVKAPVSACRLRQPASGCLHRSDQGSQYASREYVEILNKYGFRRGMSRKGDCLDNVVTESFFATLKLELFEGRPLMSRERTIRELYDYIELFYNRQRRHSTLGYMSPMKYEISRRVA
jgi:putative transposase